MSDLDLEAILFRVLCDAKLLGCAPASQLTEHADWLAEVQDNIARAYEKARSVKVAA